jgi:hypothetical protein
MAAVYWLGADGNIWYKGNRGVENVGKPWANDTKYLYDRGFDSTTGSYEAQRIADPNPPRQTAPAPAAPNGGRAAPAKVDKSNDIALQLAGLGAVDEQQGSGLSSIDRSLGSLMGQYDTETGRNEGNYRTQSDTNQGNLQKNKQTAMVNAAQGRQGLFGTLASLGALSGSGIDLANRAVQKGANDDLSGAADAYSSNQSQLDTAIGTYRDEDKARRENAKIAADNARTNVRGDAARSRLGYYTNLANNYAAMGNEGEAKRYTGMASTLFPEISRSNVPNANIAYSSAAFTPGSLAEYMAGADSTVVSATPTQPGQSMPGLVASPSKRRQRQPA